MYKAPHSNRVTLCALDQGHVGSDLISRPTGFSVFSVSAWCSGFRRFYHHGGTENTENALRQSQIRTLLARLLDSILDFQGRLSEIALEMLGLIRRIHTAIDIGGESVIESARTSANCSCPSVLRDHHSHLVSPNLSAWSRSD